MEKNEQKSVYIDQVTWVRLALMRQAVIALIATHHERTAIEKALNELSAELSQLSQVAGSPYLLECIQRETALLVMKNAEAGEVDGSLASNDNKIADGGCS